MISTKQVFKPVWFFFEIVVSSLAGFRNSAKDITAVTQKPIAGKEWSEEYERIAGNSS